MKCAIYVRVSTSDKGQTLEQQEKPLIEYCNREGWEYLIYKDHASGSKESRPQLDKMMQAIRQKEYDCVLIIRLDRLGRNLKHLLQLVEEFKNKKIRFVVLTQGIDTNTASGMLFLQIIGAVAEFERTLIQERINDKLAYYKQQIAENGQFVSKANKVISKLGRPKGSKDKNFRKRSGYLLRWNKT